MSGLDDYVNVRQASKRLSVRPETVKRWIWGGQILATKFGNAWYISRVELENFANRYQHKQGKMKKLL